MRLRQSASCGGRRRGAPNHGWERRRDEARQPCPQAPSAEIPGGSVEEDCLYLNVTESARPTERLRPVVVWLHGGGFINGAGSSYDAKRHTLQGDVVVVTVNYRLRVFGNLAYLGMKDGGTFDLLDHLAALKWARRNALSFGGDPHNVTAAGKSAGAISICAHLIPKDA